MDNQFRNAAFGGFNRQDVMEYLERISREHSDEVAALRARLEQEQQQRADLASQLEQAQAAAQLLTRERDTALREAEQNRSVLEETRSRLNSQESRLARSEQETARLHELVARLEPDASAYAAVKERTAGVELEAHRRAQGILDEARQQAAQLRGEAEQWLAQLRREYGDLCAQVESTVCHAASELDRVRQGLGNVSLCMDRQAGAMDRFLHAHEQQEQDES